MKRWWLGFGDLAVGDSFRFVFGLTPGLRVAPTVLVKVSPRRYRDPAGKVWTTGANARVALAPKGESES